MPFLAAIPAAGLIAGASLGGAGIAALGSVGAAKTQAGAAEQAAQLQYQSAQNALDFQKQQFATQQQNIAPWLQAGQGGIGQLSYLLGIGNQGQQGGLPPAGGGFGGGYSAAPGMTTVPTPSNSWGAGGAMTSGVTGARGGPLMAPTSRMLPALDGGRPIRGTTISGTAGTPPGARNPISGQPLSQAGGFGSLLQGWNQPFVPPTAATEQNDPGYQFRLQQGLGALQNSAAARGGLLSGNTLQGIEQYAQDYASNEYQNVYNRSLGQYQQNYNIFQQNQANEFNRLAALSGIGQTAAGQLSSAGQSAAGNVGNILLGSAGQIGSSLQNAGAARASGYAGAANAATGALGGLSQYAMLQSLLGGQGTQNQVPGIGYQPDIGQILYPPGVEV